MHLDNYITWSRYSAWKSSKRAFVKKYFMGIKSGFTTKEMEFGKNFHERLELGDVPEDLLEFAVGKREVSAKVPQKILTCRGEETVDLFAITDCVMPAGTIVEYKTGKTPWTQELAENHGQLYIEHATIHGITDGKAKLVWIETVEVDGKIQETGYVEVFDVELKKEKVIEWVEELLKTYTEIVYAYETYDEQDERAIKRYLYMEEIEELTIKMKEIDESVKEDLENGKIVGCDFGAYYVMNKPSLEYIPDPEAEAELDKAKKEYKKIIDSLKKAPLAIKAQEVLDRATENFKLKTKAVETIKKTICYRKSK